ncbi:MAG: SRPBCC family protein [Vicinamibacterales bacterium]
MTPEPVAERTGIAFRLRRRLSAPREDVFRAWTEPEALKRWWCPMGWVPADVDIDLRVGGTYRIGMRRLGGGRPVYVRGRFLEVNSPEQLRYTWRWENAFEEMPHTQVTVQFIDSGGTTDLVLTHENLPEIPICLRHRAGWIAALERMERIYALGDSRAPECGRR